MNSQICNKMTTQTRTYGKKFHITGTQYKHEFQFKKKLFHAIFTIFKSKMYESITKLVSRILFCDRKLNSFFSSYFFFQLTKDIDIASITSMCFSYVIYTSWCIKRPLRINDHRYAFEVRYNIYAAFFSKKIVW